MADTVLRYLVHKDNSKDLLNAQIIKAKIAMLPANCKDTPTAWLIAASPKGITGRVAVEACCRIPLRTDVAASHSSVALLH